MRKVVKIRNILYVSEFNRINQVINTGTELYVNMNLKNKKLWVKII